MELRIDGFERKRRELGTGGEENMVMREGGRTEGID